MERREDTVIQYENSKTSPYRLTSSYTPGSSNVQIRIETAENSTSLVLPCGAITELSELLALIALDMPEPVEPEEIEPEVPVEEEGAQNG